MARIAGVDLPRDKREKLTSYIWYWKSNIKQNFSEAGVSLIQE